VATSTQLVRQLRERTDAPMLECKNALAASNNDLGKAVEWLAARSQKVAASKSGRETKQGLVGLALAADGSAGAIVQLLCETDFVARNADFQASATEIAQLALAGAAEPSPAVVSDLVGKFRCVLRARVHQRALNAARENIVLGQRLVLHASAGGVVGSYLHGRLGPGVGTMAALVAVSKPGTRSLADTLALHVAGANPRCLTREQLPQDELAREEARVTAGETGKPPAVLAKIAQGRMQKYFAEHCLMDQSLIVGEDEGTPIKKLVPASVKVEGFVRLSLKP